MSRNFLLLVAVSLLSTKRYYSLTMTCALVGFLSLHVRWTSLFEAFAHVSLYLYTFQDSLPPNCLSPVDICLFLSFFSNIRSPQSLAAVQPGNLLFLNFLGRSGESTSKECISHKLNSTIARLVHLEKMYLNRHFSI